MLKARVLPSGNFTHVGSENIILAMLMRLLTLVLFVLASAAAVLQLVYAYPRLPEQIASHFGMDGRPDGWTDKASFALSYLAVVGAVVLIFPLIGVLVRALPVSLINLPHKEYWLAAERRAATFDFLSHYFLLFASATLLLLADILRQVIDFNVGRTQALGRPWVDLGVYLSAILAWAIGLFVRFRRTPAAG